MPYARIYSISEVKGMLMIAEDSANITAFRVFAAKQAKKKKVAVLANAPLGHAGVHSGQTIGDTKGRVDTGPAITSVFKTFDMQVAATVEGLNHANGQVALATLDGGAIDATFNAPLGGGYYGSRTTRIGKKGSGQATDEAFLIANQIFVKVVRYIGGNLWIQTSFPSQFNLAPVPATLAVLP